MFSIKKLSWINFSLLFFLFFVLLISLPSQTSAQNSEIIVKFKSSDPFKLNKAVLPDSTFIKNLRNRVGEFRIQSLLPQRSGSRTLQKTTGTPFRFVYILGFEQNKIDQTILDSLTALPEIEYACFNKTVKIFQNGDDPEFSKQWGLSRIHIEEAWQKTSGLPSVPIVVIDTGVEITHEDLRNQIWINSGEDLNQNGLPDSNDFNGLDDDGNGFVDDVAGWDFVDAPRYPDGGDYIGRDSNPGDENGHGTSVAGIIAAETGNGMGVAGIAPGCKVVNLRAFTSQGVGEEDDVAAAILYAVQMGFPVINMSFGDVLITPLLRDVIQYAYQNGVVMIASAGNSGDDSIHYPSGLAETISVGATNEADLRASFSSFGSSLDLMAPGNSIFTTTLRNSYGEVGGTSASAPFVSGVAGLILSLYPQMSVEVLRSRIQQSCEDLGEPGWDFEFGAGLLRADRAVADFGNATVKIISPVQDQGFGGGVIPVTATCAGALISGYELFVANGLNPTAWQSLVQETDRQIISDTLFSWTVPEQVDTIFTFRLSGHLRNGQILEDYVSILVDFSPPVVSDFARFPIISNGENGHLFSFNSDDFTNAAFNFRSSTVGEFQTKELGFQNTRHAGLLFPGQEELYFKIVNQAGLKTVYPEPPSLLQFSYDQDRIYNFLRSSNQYLNPGYFFRFATDFDQDGNPEILMNEYDAGGNFGKLVYWELQENQFGRIKNTQLRLIPRDVADVNGDGKLDVLAGAGKTSVILAASGSDPFPNSIVWLDTNDVWAARFFDFDKDGYPELIAKVGNDWKIWQNNRDYSFFVFSDLPNFTEGENGTGVPHVEIGDFDNDNKIELLFGDYDGDILLYEISSSLQPTFEWSDRLPLIDAIDFIASGDYDGDGQLEFAAGCHSDEIIDLEHQFDERHWLFRIYDFVAGSYQVVWQQRFHPYFPPKDFDSGVSSGDVTGDGKDELLLSIYPNLYLVSFDATSSEYNVSGHFQTVRSNRVVVSDFDVDGDNEILLNTGTRSRLFEYYKEAATVPIFPTNLKATALDSKRVQVTWDNFVLPDSFRVYRGADKESLYLLSDNWTEKYFIDSTVIVDQIYWYQVSKYRTGFPEIFTNKVSVTPHRPARVVAAKVFPPNQLLLTFSLPMSETVSNNQSFFLLPAGLNPVTAVQSSNLRDVILSWGNDFVLPEIDTLLLSALTDSSGTPLDQRDFKIEILNTGISQSPYIVKTEFVEQNRLQIEFSQSMELTSMVNKNNYQFEPEVTILTAKSIQPSNKIVELKLKPKRPIGPIGVQHTLFIQNVISRGGIPIDQEIGHRVTFIFVAKNLANVYVYPNPARDHVTFARLSNEAEIEVYNSSGILIKKLEAKTINGGFNWNLLDKNNFPIPAGIYIFRIYNEQESHWGKFAVVR